MLEDLEKLLRIQERDLKLNRLKKEKQDLPLRRKEIESRLADHQQAVLKAKDQLKHQMASIKEAEVLVETHQQRITKLRDQQLQIKSNVEYKALENEIAGVKKQISGQEDQELVLMEQAEKLRADVALREKDLQAEEKLVQADVAELQQRLVAVDQELADQEAERKQLAANIAPEALARFERIFKHVQGAAIVGVDNGNCKGCRMKLPPQLVHDTIRGDKLTLCSNCGRILYAI